MAGTRIIYKGYVEIEADEQRGVIWVNGEQGICRIRICNITRLHDRIKGQIHPNIDVRACDPPKPTTEGSSGSQN